jgi:hypothetical protein
MMNLAGTPLRQVVLEQFQVPCEHFQLRDAADCVILNQPSIVYCTYRCRKRNKVEVEE